jgi:hypothetical protein
MVGRATPHCPGFRCTVSGWSDEETRDPLYADDRNFYKVEQWTRDGTLERLLYAGNNLAKARDIFARAVKHRPRIGGLRRLLDHFVGNRE